MSQRKIGNHLKLPNYTSTNNAKLQHNLFDRVNIMQCTKNDVHSWIQKWSLIEIDWSLKEKKDKKGYTYVPII